MEDDKLRWKTLSSEYLYTDTWLKARKDRCIRSDGKIIDPYYVMEYPEWVTAFAITEENTIVLVKQYRHALGEVCIELPGGCIDNDEVAEAAVRREFLEETGYAFDTAEYLGFTSPNPSTNANRLHMFLMQGGKKVQEQQLHGAEQIVVLTVSMQELRQLFAENKFVQAMHVTNIFYALQKLNMLHLEHGKTP